MPAEEIHACRELLVMAESEEAGVLLAMAGEGRQIFVMGIRNMTDIRSIMNICVIKRRICPFRYRSIIIRRTTVHSVRPCFGDLIVMICILTG